MSDTQNVTRLLERWQAGDAHAVDELFPLVYDELREIAHYRLKRARRGHTLNTTALVHEVYMRLVDYTEIDWQGRTHFFSLAAQVMRNVLVDYARKRNAQKRGGSQPPLSLDENRIAIDEQAELVLSLDQALTQLGALNARLCQVVEYRFFGGMTNEEIAAVLDVSTRTVRRDWVKARAWLYNELHPDTA